MSIDFTKTVKTRDGRKVFIYTTEGVNPDRPVVGEYQDLSGPGLWILFRRPRHGRESSEYQTKADLVNVPQQHTVTLNVYRRQFCTELYVNAHGSRSEADQRATSNRIACFEHTFTEGDGLE